MTDMNLDEYKNMWESEKTDWVLVKTKYGYVIVNKKTHMALLVSDEDLEDAIIQRMLQAGNLIYDNINDAYADTESPKVT